MSATLPPTYTITQNTQRPWCFDITSTVDPITGAATDLTLVTSVSLYVHRGVTQAVPAGTSIETWTCSIDNTYAPPTTTTLRGLNTPAASGSGSVTIANERIQLRPILAFATGPTVECSVFFLSVAAE